MNIFKTIILFLAIILLLGAAFYSYEINYPLNSRGQEREFVVNKGDGVKTIAANLKRDGLIRSELFFEAYVLVKKIQSKFKAGAYTLSPQLNMREISNIFIKGETSSKERSIKIIEGWNVRDIGNYLEYEAIVQSEEFLESVGFNGVDYSKEKEKNWPKDYSSQFSFLADKPKYAGLEGYLFPDTYRIYKDAEANDVILKMLSNFDKKLTKELREEIRRQGRTVFEIVTLASIIERETGRDASTPAARQAIAEERKIVAGIFMNRLKIGMKLDSDATVNYVTGKKDPAPLLEDTRVNSPYNTYINKGLPPGPIANPSLSSIIAVIYPAKTDYLYFLHKQPSGEPVYAKTFEQHILNKNKFLK